MENRENGSKIIQQKSSILVNNGLPSPSHVNPSTDIASANPKKHGPIGWVYSLDNPTYQVQYKSMDALRFLESYLSYSLSSPSFSASSIEVHANECKQNDRWRREKSTFKRLPRWTSQSFMTVNQVKHPIQISFQAYPWISTICIYIPL